MAIQGKHGSVRHWTKREDHLLIKMLLRRTPVQQIAEHLQRSISAIQQRATITHSIATGHYQREGEEFIFKCGCSGVLIKRPTKLAVYYIEPNRGTHRSGDFQSRNIRRIGNKNKLTKTRRLASSDRWQCRITYIILSSNHHAKQFGGLPVICQDHSIIRKMMENPNCVECGKPLKWIFGRGKTPHLDHDHETGRPIGFAHPSCNRNKRERGELKMVQELIKLGYLVIRKEDVHGVSLHQR